MIFQGTETLTTLIHIVSESLLVPTIVLLVVFIVIVLLCFGSFINEKITRRPIDAKELEVLIRKLSNSTSVNEMNKIVDESKLYKEQKEILTKLNNTFDIGSEARKALASKLIEKEESELIKNTSITDILVRVAPLFGLLGTLIPLGPGLSALGTGDVNTLAQALIVAFDTTVVGVAVAALAYVISKYRKLWYDSDLSTTEALAETILENLNKHY